MQQRADAEDVVAGTFAVAWRRFADAPAEELRLAWLYAIAARVLANQRRSLRRLSALRSRLRAQPPAGAPERVELDEVLVALGELRPEEQEALRLSAWEGLTNTARRRARLLRERRGDPAPSRPQAARRADRERNGAGRTFSGRRDGTSERDVMKLLADANPVRVDDLAQMDIPDLARRRSHGRLLLVAAAAVVAAGAAASIAIFAFPSSRLSTGPGPGALRAGTPWQTIALSDASTALGAQVVLPNTDFVQPSDAASQARKPGCSADSCAVFVSFPAQSLGISYTRPAPFADPRAQWAADVRTAPAHHAEAQLVDLNGVPGDYIDYPGVKRLVEFVAGDTWIVVGGAGDYDKATLQAVAQSILDRSAAPSPSVLAGPASPGTPVADAAAADRLLPFDVLLPSDATPTSLAVLEQSHQLDAYFDTPTSGPYDLVEGPSTETVAVLRETAKRWRVGPIHEIDVVDGVDVLLQGSSDGSLVASWIRVDGGSKILTWVKGPETAEGGKVEGSFTKQQALAVAADIIAQGG